MRLLDPIADALDRAHAAGPDAPRHQAAEHPRRRRATIAYLADFGLTRSATEPGLTKTGQFVGTVDYVAPEQIRGEQAARASDIYALAAVLYECLSGDVPYPRPSDARGPVRPSQRAAAAGHRPSVPSSRRRSTTSSRAAWPRTRASGRHRPPS